MKKISHAEQTSPEKDSIWTFGSGADEIFAMYSTMASQNFDTAVTQNNTMRYSNGFFIYIYHSQLTEIFIIKMGFYDKWKHSIMDNICKPKLTKQNKEIKSNKKQEQVHVF